MHINMPLNSDIKSALRVLEHIHETIQQSNAVKLQAETTDDFKFLQSLLENPVFRSIVTIQDSVKELNRQMHDHPSLVPDDFDITLTGKLILNLPAPKKSRKRKLISKQHECLI